MRALILTYHSHHMAGSTYASNDHVALERDLRTIDEAGYELTSLDALVDAFIAEKQRSDTVDGQRLVAITFDDGPEYDVVDFDHPTLGFQRSFLGILQDFHRECGYGRHPRLHATSFVIASPAARRAIESLPDKGSYYLHPGALNDRWWSSAIDTGLISIANHSWDHLHPGLSRVAHTRQAKANFGEVNNDADADSQILLATRYIDERTGGRAAPFFAYPFGQYNRFLIEDYFQRHRSRLRIRAGFTVDGRPLHESDTVWALPRFSCGYNWSSPADLLGLLNPS